MGIQSEITASLTAKRLESILLECIGEDFNSPESLFCKRHLWPFYKDEKAEAFEDLNEQLKIYFER